MNGTANNIAIYADTRSIGRCNGPNCGKLILWATLASTGKKMCFDDTELPALRTYHEEGSGRLIEVVDRDANHWASCVDSKRFRDRR